MIKTTTIKLEPSDIAFLKQTMPISPCENCSAARDGSCCGCPDHTLFMKLIHTDDKDLLELAEEIQSIKKMANNIKNELKQIERKAGEIRDLVGTDNFLEIMGGTVNEMLI